MKRFGIMEKMMKVLILILAMILSASSTGFCEMFAGNELANVCKEKDVHSFNKGVCLGFITSAAETASKIPFRKAKLQGDIEYIKKLDGFQDSTSYYIGIPEKVKIEKIMAIVVKFMHDYPKFLDDEANYIVLLALREEYGFREEGNRFLKNLWGGFN